MKTTVESPRAALFAAFYCDFSRLGGSVEVTWNVNDRLARFHY